MCQTGIAESVEVCCCCGVKSHVGAEVVLSWSTTWHVGGTHMLGQHGGGAHSAEVD
jgi:hypothetical protein